VAGRPAPLFLVPLEIEGQDIGGAVIDTGGGYEILLRENFGLEVIDEVEVLAFGGRETVAVTEGFSYSAGGFQKVARTAIVSSSICDCNGLGFFFFRDTGVVLGIDFVKSQAMFLERAPDGGVSIPFAPPPANLNDFGTAFMEVDIATGDETTQTLALIDTGANVTLIRRGLLESSPALNLNRQEITISHDFLGTVAVSVGLYDTEGLPDVILGTDVMGAWGNEWYFTYTQSGGSITIIRPSDTAEESRVAPQTSRSRP
jgi:hypothetical protein